MTITKNKHGHHHANHDLHNDVEKIKAALMDATMNVKGKAADILSDSVDGMKEKSTAMKNNVANYTAEKPLQSLGVVFLVGVAIGYLLHK